MGTVYLIPSLLHETGLDAIPSYVKEAIKNCQVFFVENERTTRRFFKQLWSEMIIDDYSWFRIDESSVPEFKRQLKEGKNIGIVSEAGCPGVADPGQSLIAIAQEMNVTIKPLAGPSSILLSLMASGMNGQHFRFAGYLPIDNLQRIRAIKELEAESARNNCTQIFIETPYRNIQLFEAIVNNCKSSTRLCIAKNLTSDAEYIYTKTIGEWRSIYPDLHKQTCIFLLHS
jgi:16S rRNA (cytidine1402-2'-O)-methyltransferase